MQASRWADDIRTQDKAQNRPSWHYINLPFKPDGQPADVQIREPEPVNILTAMAENESVVKNENDPERKAIALAWLSHLVGDIHQPLHAAQIFTVDYPNGDRGGNEICVRVLPGGYITIARRIAEKRMILSGYRLADLLTRVTRNLD